MFLRHPRDRKHVLTSLLTRVMENNVKNQIPCPLRDTVMQSLLKDIGYPSDTTISATHAAWIVANVANIDKEDPSIKYGINFSLRSKLLALKTKQDHPTE